MVADYKIARIKFSIQKYLLSLATLTALAHGEESHTNPPSLADVDKLIRTYVVLNSR